MTLHPPETASVELRPTDPAHPDARRCVEAYFAELDRRSETGFDVSDSLEVAPDDVRPPAGVTLVAYLRGEAVGCGSVKHPPGAPAEIKRLWLSEAVRGQGVGRRMLEALEARAREHGARTVRLDTNRNLVEAIAMYRSAGYRDVPPFNDEAFAHHWFEKEL